MKTEHTPTPWTHDPEGKSGDASELFSGGRPIAEFGLTAAYEEDCANAAFATLAVNNHEPLRAALLNLLNCEAYGTKGAAWKNAAATARAVLSNTEP